jgi:hypothetical protein
MQWFWDRKAVKAPRVKGGGAILVRMSLSDGGDAGLEEAEAGGMRARLVGRDVDMIESPSQSCKTDDGRGEACLEGGLEVIGVGDCPRNWAFGILPVGVSGHSTTNEPYYRSKQQNVISCRRK